MAMPQMATSIDRPLVGNLQSYTQQNHRLPCERMHVCVCHFKSQKHPQEGRLSTQQVHMKHVLEIAKNEGRRQSVENTHLISFHVWRQKSLLVSWSPDLGTLVLLW